MKNIHILALVISNAEIIYFSKDVDVGSICPERRDTAVNVRVIGLPSSAICNNFDRPYVPCVYTRSA